MKKAAKIERNIPLPIQRGHYSTYPFGEMKVGDSFLVRVGDQPDRLRQAACHYARRSGVKMKFSILKIADGYRCWRVS
jgi:hypothetical protein